ncbi:DUF2235 domain-containing protein [Niveibacterium sp. COAC-50]|uniref:T6SS phospholipase effector Tle1-like catalytic domain-containing protein n=1 Tax=Niveibacterium sp. COAC-50 TaxID=2729384 RepID=UPI0015537139|nr:DUF2235 domain-containing protein [Niveibacterium sp. COAC-50]
MEARAMSAFIPPTPAQPATTPFSTKEMFQRARSVSQDATSAPGCMQTVSIGVFFDGTNNNKKRDQEDVKDPNARSHSNIVVLHDAYADVRPRHYRIYVPGVGTPFPKIGELTESSDGKSMAKGGEARLYWAMIQVINAIHRAANEDRPMIPDSEAKQLINGPSFLAAQGFLLTAESRRRGVFHELGRRLRAGLKDKKPAVCLVNLSVFGFSRGAAEARAFCKWMVDLCEPASGRQAFFGVPLRFQFLGLFDTVASVGLANSAPVPNDGGFMGWADGTMELPDAIEQCVHYVAAHEIRKSFPLSTVRKSKCPTEERIYPGAHSDVGGGYAPGEHGKAKSRDELLSQVPLIHMYQAARKAGVPLMEDAELERNGREETMLDLRIDETLAARFNEYRRVGPGSGDIGIVHLEHMRLYWRWRIASGVKFESLASYRAANTQDRVDLAASEMDFRRDLAQATRDEQAVKWREAHPVQAGFVLANSHPKDIAVLSKAEEIALAELRAKAAVPPLVAEFFDHHVHDSHASFYLVGPTSAYDRAQMIKAVEAKQKAGKPLNGFERRVAALQKTNPGAYPIMTDADYNDLLEMDGWKNEATIKWAGMTATRRESEGHVRERVLFDQS